VAALIPQPFTAYLPPCLETLAREGAQFGRDDTRVCLGCIALHYRIEAQKSNPPINDDEYDLVPMLRHINKLCHEPLSEQELEQIDVEVRCSKRSKLACRELKRSETLKNCCVPDDCALNRGGGLDPGVDPEIHEKAMDVLKNGDPERYIVDSCSRIVLGAEKAFKKLDCCVSVQDVRQSAGLHPKLNGDSGSGKTLVVMVFAHHLPPDAVVVGSTSNLAAFYHQDGDRVFRILDDYLAGNEVLDTIIKQTSSVFHKRYTHRTVKKQEPVTLQIGSEQTWAITSVDGSQDIQVLNRQLPINVDDSEELTRAVNARTIERYGRGEEQFPEDETVLVCREIWRILRSEGHINVRVPFYDRIEWLENSNRRNPSIFMDLLVAHTAMYRFQREKDAEGYYLATEDDFEAAKALFNDKDAEELVKRLTRKEREFVELLSKHPEGLTREEVADALKITGNRVSQLANGEKGRGGLTQKLPGFSIAEITDSIRIDDDQRRAIKRTVYKLSRYDPLTGFEAVVRLLPKTDSSNGGKDGKEPVRVPVRIAQSKETSNRERENREIEIGSKDSKEKEREGHGQGETQEKISLSLKNSEKSLPQEKTATGGHEAILTGSLPVPYRPYSKAAHSESKSLPDEQNPPNGDFSASEEQNLGHELSTATVILRFFVPVSAFVGIDLKEYGPFRPEDVATVPTIHAKNLIASGYAREIIVPTPPPFRARSIEEQNKAREEHFAKLAAKYTKDAAQESDATS